MMPTHQSTRPPFARDFPVGAQHTLSRLRRRFPDAFGQVKPLKLGIHFDIQERAGMDSLQVGQFMTFYTRCAAYLQAQVRPGAMRHDLDGNPVEPVSEQNRAYALAELDCRNGQRRDQNNWLAFRAALLEPVVISDKGEL
jgi:sRNA-binding protein